MERREFVKSALASAAALTPQAQAAVQVPASTREFYHLRKYSLRSGPQTALTQKYIENALIPALNRLHISNVGAFKLDVGPETPTYYVLIPSTSAETLVNLDTLLHSDDAYLKAAAGFRDAPPSAPAYERNERTLLSAFTGWPKLTVPKHEKRIFQLRTYESPSQAAHQRKVAMFNDAEYKIFLRAGLNPVFFGDTLIGTRMPSLTYMLTFPSIADLTANWAKFSADPEWKALSGKPENADIVSNVTNLYLSPLDCSQI